MPYTGEACTLRESEHAVYRNEIARLHGQLDIKNAANQILRDAMTAQRANCAVEMARVRREMAPGFCWPDPDGAFLLLAKVASQESTMTKMATKLAKISAENGELKMENGELKMENGELKMENGELKAENGELKAENAVLKAKLAANGEDDSELNKAIDKLNRDIELRDVLREQCAHLNDAYRAGLVAKFTNIVNEIGAIRRVCSGDAADRLGTVYGELELVAREISALYMLCRNLGESGVGAFIVKMDEIIAERDALRNLYAHHNTSGKNPYSKRRSKVNEDIQQAEKEVAEELGIDLDTERAKAAAGSEACRAEGQCEGHKGSSHHRKPDEKIWYTRTQCPSCRAIGCLVRRRAAGVLVSEFFEDRMSIKTTCHIGVVYDCAACGRCNIAPDLPNIKGTWFGKKALSFIVHLGGKKNVDIDIAELFGDMFDFPTGETTIWNARCAATDLLEPTMMIIRNALKKAKHLGIDETYYASEGDSGYVWVVRTNQVTFVLAMNSRGGDVIEKYMSDLLHIPVTTDGYSPYLTHFKILQRCWAHILRAAEATYVELNADDPKRAYYVELYKKLLKIFRDAKRVAAETAADGGADHTVCAKFEARVMNLVEAYGNHKFATTLGGAAPNLFTFLRHPGMPPTNNDTERDIRDAVVVQRKIRRRFVNARGRHVFSVIQSFNSTCRKLGLVPWKCMSRIIDDPEYDILEAGDDVKRRVSPWSETKAPTHRLYIDGKAVETNGVILNEKTAEELTAKITAEAAKQQSVQGGVETESTASEPVQTIQEAVQGGVETESTASETIETIQEAVQGGVETESTASETIETIQEPTTPEPVQTIQEAVQGGVETESTASETIETIQEPTTPEPVQTIQEAVQGGVETESTASETIETIQEPTTPEPVQTIQEAVQGGVETESTASETIETIQEPTTPEPVQTIQEAVQGGVETESTASETIETIQEPTTPEPVQTIQEAVQGGVETESTASETIETIQEPTTPEPVQTIQEAVQGGVETESTASETIETIQEPTTPEPVQTIQEAVQGGVETESTASETIETIQEPTTPEPVQTIQEAVQGGVETESTASETIETIQEPTTPEPVQTIQEAVQGGVETESTASETIETIQEAVQEPTTPEECAKVNVMSHSQTHLASNDRPSPMQPCILGVTGHEQVTDPRAPNTQPYRGKPPPAVAA